MNSNSGNRALQESEARLLKANTAYWDKILNITDGADWIYILHTLTTAVLPSVHENIVAKGLQEKEKLPIISVISGKANKFLDKLDESFGIEHRFHSSYHEFDSAEEREQVEKLAKQISLSTYGDKDKLLGLTYRGIAYGNAIYDDILRRGNSGKRGEVFSCFDISLERYFVFIRNALTVINQAYKLFEARKPRYLVTSEYIFTKGLYACVASVLGAQIIYASIEKPDIMMRIDSNRWLLHDVKITDVLEKMRGNCYQRHQQGAAKEHTFFVVDMPSSVSGHIAESTPKGGRKKVFILPHALCDAPRQICRHNIYNDYNEWFLDTIRIAKEVPDVDWIIKDHPLAACYGQCGYIKSIYEKNLMPNLHWYDKDYSGMMIKDIADCVITCAGDAGIEYWAYGIPTITTSDAYYCRWGISYQMRSVREYEDTLRRVQSIALPQPESVESARKHIQAFKNWGNAGDTFATLFRDFREMEQKIFRIDGVNFENNDWENSRLEDTACEFCDAYALLLQTENLTASAVYQLTNLWDV